MHDVHQIELLSPPIKNIILHLSQNNNRPLNLLTLFTVRATPFYSEICLSHSEICVQWSQSTRFRGTKHVQFMCIAKKEKEKCISFLSRGKKLFSTLTWAVIFRLLA